MVTRVYLTDHSGQWMHSSALARQCGAGDRPCTACHRRGPLEVWARMNLHAYLQAAGRDREALEQLNKVLELDENQVVALVSKAMIHADQGDLPEALAIARRAYATGPWLPDTTGVLAALLRRKWRRCRIAVLGAETWFRRGTGTNETSVFQLSSAIRIQIRIGPNLKVRFLSLRLCG
jgi:tetratricopeptide (TPR) repeat protein